LVTKIYLHARVPIIDWATFYKALEVGPSIPSWLVALVFFFTFVMVTGLTIYFSIKSTSEFSDIGRRKEWKL